jgi:hypothetical protein
LYVTLQYPSFATACPGANREGVGCLEFVTLTYLTLYYNLPFMISELICQYIPDFDNQNNLVTIGKFRSLKTITSLPLVANEGYKKYYTFGGTTGVAGTDYSNEGWSQINTNSNKCNVLI